MNEFIDIEDQEVDTKAQQNNLYAYLTMFLLLIFN